MSNKKSSKKLLEEYAEELRKTQEIAGIGRWHLDIKKNKLSWSTGIYELFETNSKEFKATYEAFLKRVHPDDRKFVDRSYTESLKNRTSYDITHRIVTPKGKVKWVREICETVYDKNGNPLESTGTVQDISKIKKVEERLKEKISELEKFTKVAVGRELKMRELKEKIKELEKEVEKLSIS